MRSDVRKRTMVSRAIALFLLLAATGLVAAGCGSDDETSRKGALTTGESEQGGGGSEDPAKGKKATAPPGGDETAAPEGKFVEPEEGKPEKKPPSGNPPKIDAHLEERVECAPGELVMSADALLVWPPKGGQGTPEQAKAKGLRPELGLGKPEEFKETRGKPDSKEFTKENNGKKVASVLVVKYGPNWNVKAIQACQSAISESAPAPKQEG